MSKGGWFRVEGLGFRVCRSENALRSTLTWVLSGAQCYGDHAPTHP